MLDHRISATEGAFPPVLISNCQGVFVRDVVVKNSDYTGPALALVDSGDAVVDGFTLQGETNALTSGVAFIISTNAVNPNLSGLRISHVSARNLKDGGIILESQNLKGTLSDYLISENLAEVIDRIHERNGIVAGNVSLTSPADNKNKIITEKKLTDAVRTKP